MCEAISTYKKRVCIPALCFHMRFDTAQTHLTNTSQWISQIWKRWQQSIQFEVESETRVVTLSCEPDVLLGCVYWRFSHNKNHIYKPDVCLYFSWYTYVVFHVKMSGLCPKPSQIHVFFYWYIVSNIPKHFYIDGICLEII